MKWNKKLLSALLTVVMALTILLPAAAAAELPAAYSQASYYSIATTAYSRMLLFYDGRGPRRQRLPPVRPDRRDRQCGGGFPV